jgi:hypothetical protein
MDQHPDNSTDHPPDEEQESALPVVELETLLSRPPSWRKRLVQMGLALAALVVVLVTFRDALIPRPPPALPVHVQPTLPPPTLTILSNVTYGTITIDGQVVRGSPRVIHMTRQPPYTVTLTAPPFRPLTCHFPDTSSLAPGAFDPCLDGGEFAVNQQPTRTIQMLFTLADLPPDQQQQIKALVPQMIAIQQTLDVPAHSTIVTSVNADGTANTRQMSEPLRASVSLVPEVQPQYYGVSCDGPVCVGFTSMSAPGDSVNGNFWEISTSVALRWRFTTASGQVVSDVTFSPDPAMQQLFLSYAAATGWQPQFTSPATLSQELTQQVCPTGTQVLLGEQLRYLSGEDWNETVLHDQGIAGCALELTMNNVDQGHFVWRFGALLAADANAHHLLPALPVASPADLAAVGG